ncbi:lipopolysaccharide core heptose(II) kinase RfaY [Escherichia coli]
MIDLSGKRASAQRKAKDRIDLERHYGIKKMRLKIQAIIF